MPMMTGMTGRTESKRVSYSTAAANRGGAVRGGAVRGGAVRGGAVRGGAIAAALSLGWVASSTAHHGITAQFDTSTTFEISGVVTELEFVNPHAYVYFDATSPNGDVVPWRCELRAATVLRRSGWSEDMFSPGTVIDVLGSPDRRDPQTCYLVNVTFANGVTVERYEQLTAESLAGDGEDERPARLAGGRPNIGGDWARPQRLLGGENVLGTGPAQQARNAMGMGASVQLTEHGAAAVAGYQWEDNPRFQCMAVNIFADWTFDQHVNRIVQEDGRITLMYGFMDIVRVIHLDMDEHPAEIEPSRAGHSIGRWEGDELVVETTGFLPGYLETRNAVMHGADMHVVERFAYDHEAGTLTRSWVAEDPTNFSGSYTGQDAVEIADIPFEPYNCSDLTNEHVGDTA